MSLKQILFVCGFMLAAVCWFASTPCSAATTVDVAVSNLGAGIYEYTWTVGYDGLNPTDYGQLEVYLPTLMNSATNNVKS